MSSKAVLIFSIFYFLSAHAEYRVFELEISTYDEVESTDTSPPQPPVTGSAPVPNQAAPARVPSSTRTVLSTLDPEQYRGYHTVAPNEEVTYINTWRCFGRTNGKDFCPNPKVKESDSN